MHKTFSLFFFALLSPTITIQQLSELSSSSDIFRQFTRRYSCICIVASSHEIHHEILFV